MGHSSSQPTNQSTTIQRISICLSHFSKKKKTVQLTIAVTLENKTIQWKIKSND